MKQIRLNKSTVTNLNVPPWERPKNISKGLLGALLLREDHQDIPSFGQYAWVRLGVYYLGINPFALNLNLGFTLRCCFPLVHSVTNIEPPFPFRWRVTHLWTSEPLTSTGFLVWVPTSILGPPISQSG
jgi:hypothetical protein